MAIEVTAVIPTWNRWLLLRDVLRDLAEQTHPLAEVIVVDNASNDETAQRAEEMGARVLRQSSNLGFAKAVNIGVKAAQTSHVAILNNDVRLAAHWLEHLAAHADQTFVAPKIYQAEVGAVLDGSFDLLSRSGCAWRAGHGQADGPEWNVGRAIQFVPFTAVLFQRELFEQVGYLEESFESYLEDVEFGLRCAMAGRQGWYEPRAQAWHLGSATLGAWSPAMVRRISRNQVWLVRKHFPGGMWRWRVLVGQGLWGVLAFRNAAFGAWVKGKWEGVLGKCGDAGEGDVVPVLRECEREIRRLQQQGGWDTFWRLYFALTGAD